MATITIETIQSGQPRAYADSFYEFKVHFTDDAAKPRDLSRTYVASILKAICHTWQDKPDNWASPHLNFLVPIKGTEAKWKGSEDAASGWHMLVTEAYTD